MSGRRTKTTPPSTSKTKRGFTTTGQNGQIQYNQAGQPVMTQNGQRFYGHMSDLQNAGMNDPYQIYQEALIRMQAEQAVQQPPPQPVQQQPAAQLQSALPVAPPAPTAQIPPHLQAGAPSVGHGPALPHPTGTPPAAQPFWNAFDAASQQPSSSGTIPASPADPVQNAAPSNGEGYFERAAMSDFGFR